MNEDDFPVTLHTSKQNKFEWMQKQNKHSMDFWNYSGESESETHDKSEFLLFEVELTWVQLVITHMNYLKCSHKLKTGTHLPSNVKNHRVNVLNKS